MKKITLFLFFCASGYAANAQLVVNYHLSNLSFIGAGYQINDRVLPELRLAGNVAIDNFSPELMVSYQFVKKEIVEYYAGIGIRVNIDDGVVIPTGLNIYPFEEKRFGFHIEVAPIILLPVEGDANMIFRTSTGIRFRFTE